MAVTDAFEIIGNVEAKSLSDEHRSQLFNTLNTIMASRVDIEDTLDDDTEAIDVSFVVSGLDALDDFADGDGASSDEPTLLKGMFTALTCFDDYRIYL